MPCKHKFSDFLDLQKVDFEPKTLIIGTFSPDIPTNKATWFYGRTQHNHFWEVLPRLYHQESLINATDKEWKFFCKKHQIAITDLITEIYDADLENDLDFSKLSSYKDEDLQYFYDFGVLNLVKILRQHPKIQAVYITRSTNESFWKNQCYAINRYCENKNIYIKNLLTPSGFASFQQGKHNKLYPQNPLNLDDYILWRWEQVWKK